MRRLLIAAVLAAGFVTSTHTAHAQTTHTTSCYPRRVFVDRTGHAGWAHECVVQTHKTKPAPATLPACYWPAVRRYSAYIEAAAYRSGIPAGWIAAVIEQESGGDPSATSQGFDSADIGLMQFGTAEAAAVGGVYTYDPAGNIMTGSLILAYYRSHYAGGSLTLAVAMYNGGPGNPQWGYESAVASKVCS